MVDPITWSPAAFCAAMLGFTPIEAEGIMSDDTDELAGGASAALEGASTPKAAMMATHTLRAMPVLAIACRYRMDSSLPRERLFEVMFGSSGLAD
jgi:hypothetical protein